MSTSTQLAPHEILELRELMSVEILGAKKLQASMSIVKDEDLKYFMQKCLQSKKDKIHAMQGFIENNTNVGQEGNEQCQY